MALVCRWKCPCGFEMDFYDTARVPKANKTGYYLTLLGLKEIEIYMAENGYIDKLGKDQKDIDLFIQKGWIKKYED